jgi:hypothetical protein
MSGPKCEEEKIKAQVTRKTLQLKEKVPVPESAN